jgi:murein endopeptidase
VSARAPGAIRGGIARETRSVLFGGARRRRLLARLLALAVVLVLAGAAVALTAGPVDARPYALPRPVDASRAIGAPWRGRLLHGVELPASGADFFTWDPALNRSPNRWWRRFGTLTLIRTLTTVIAEYRAAHPGVARVGIGDLSRPHGGPFGREFGSLGHASHQNGRDADVWYPRLDGTERRPFRVDEVDRPLAQDLVDRFVAAGAVKVFVGPDLHLRGPRGIVVALAHHDDHLHVRIAQPR